MKAGELQGRMGIPIDPNAQLRELRAQCVATIEAIDAILAAQPKPTPDPLFRRPFIVRGVCAEITTHALDRYRERTGSKKSDEKVLNSICARLASAKELQLKPKFRLRELLSHGTPSRFFWHGGMIFVVENGVLVTAHAGTADRWEPIPVTGLPVTDTQGSTGYPGGDMGIPISGQPVTAE